MRGRSKAATEALGRDENDGAMAESARRTGVVDGRRESSAQGRVVGQSNIANCVFPSSPPLTAFPKALSPTEARVRLVQMGNQWLHRESY